MTVRILPECLASTQQPTSDGGRQKRITDIQPDEIIERYQRELDERSWKFIRFRSMLLSAMGYITSVDGAEIRQHLAEGGTWDGLIETLLTYATFAERSRERLKSIKAALAEDSEAEWWVRHEREREDDHCERLIRILSILPEMIPCEFTLKHPQPSAMLGVVSE